MEIYELIVKRDQLYGLEKSPYVLGRIIGVLEGSGANIVENTFQINVKYPMKVSFMADQDQLGRIKGAINKSYPSMINKGLPVNRRF